MAVGQTGYDPLVESARRDSAPVRRPADGPADGPQAADTALPAAVGQPALMALYRQLAAAVGVEVCQILVSRSDLASARAMGDLGQRAARGHRPRACCRS